MKENYFKFTLSYKNFIISQTIENADSYSKDSFKMVNLRDFITPLIKDFQNVLSLKTSKMDSNFYGYDLIKYKNFMISPYSKIFNIDQKTGYSEDIKPNSEYGEGLLFKFSYGDEKILEREFAVRNFNFNTIFSKELYDTTKEWVDKIMNRVKFQDSNMMWDDVSLMYHFNLNEEEVKNLLPLDRKNKMSKINKKEIIW